MSFNIGEWITDNLISGVANGTFSREYVAMLAANYLLKGLLAEAQVQRIAEETTPVAEDETADGTDGETSPEEATEP